MSSGGLGIDMCLSLKIKASPCHDTAPIYYRVPCGHCKECNEVYQKSWAFRIRVEMEYLAKQGWQAGFCTLTYNDNYLPKMPRSLFKHPNTDYRDVQCFSRDDCELFIRRLRSWLWRKYRLQGADAVRYMLCAEYGSSTKRSHYHALFIVPPDVDMGLMYAKIQELWTVNGFVFPRYYLGGTDSDGYVHKPFKVDSLPAAAKYISKYTTKDIYYLNYIESKGLSEDSFYHNRLYRRCAQFHLQSRGLGRSMLDGLTDKQKLDVLDKGYSFVGDDKLYTIPVYIKNKLLFDNCYVYQYERPSCGQTGEDDIVFYRAKRLCRRDASMFFVSHFREIFELKAAKYKDLFVKLSTPSQVVARGVSAEWGKAAEVGLTCQKYFAECLTAYGIDAKDFARVYLATYGVPDNALLGARWDVQWFAHYENPFLWQNREIDGWPVISEFDDFGYVDDLDMIHAVSAVATYLFDVWFSVPSVKTEDEKRIDRVRDSYLSKEY